MLSARPHLLLALATALLTAGCTDAPAPAGDGPAAVAWTEAALPAPAGARALVRDATWCGDRWLVVGGVVRDAGVRPAAWTSEEGTAWRTVRVRATTYWGSRAVLTSVACVRDVPAAVGFQSGGAHGNPRVTTYRSAGDGTWVDVEAPVVRYGGSEAVNVGTMASGEPGWLVVGNRVSGPAVWVADRPALFRLVEGAPRLADRGAEKAIAQDAVWDGRAWTVVGGAVRPGTTDRAPRAWRSDDGRRWRREQVPSSGPHADLLAAVRSGEQVVAAGTSGDRFRLWHRDGDGWVEGAAFGTVADTVTSAPDVTGLAATPDGLWAAVSDGARYRLHATADGGDWTEVSPPVAPAVSADHAFTVAGGRDAVLLAVDDGTGGRVWLTDEEPAP